MRNLRRPYANRPGDVRDHSHGGSRQPSCLVLPEAMPTRLSRLPGSPITRHGEDVAVEFAAGETGTRPPPSSRPLPVIGALIAATARVHGMTVVTRNVKDFELAGVDVFNPFAE